MIIGADIGYFNTKYTTKNKKGLFTSVIERDTLGLNKSMLVTYDGVTYNVGSTGSFVADSDKTNDINFKLCLYTAIADGMQGSVDNSVQLVTGLPIAYYTNQKDNLKKSLLNNVVDLTLIKDGISTEKTFIISDVAVFPQSAGLMILRPDLFTKNAYNLVIDIGGYTTDVSLFKGIDLIRYRTFQKGMLKLNGLIRNHLSMHGFDMPLIEVSDIIAGTSSFDAFVNKEEIAEIIRDYISGILSDIKIEFNEYKFAKLNYIGGGSKDLQNFLKGNIVADSIYVNSNAFYNIGAVTW